MGTGRLGFKEIENVFGNFDVDLFASSRNAKVPRFVSWYIDPDSIAVDAFTLSCS